jgi:drug/metabolite transporter (DMT)-like permease
MMIVLDRRFTVLQWISLILSLLGVVIVQLGGQPYQSGRHTSHPLHPNATDQLFGLLATAIMCLTTAFGSRFSKVLPFIAYF